MDKNKWFNPCDDVGVQDDHGYRSHCWFCKGAWGECKCTWPPAFDHEGKNVENVDGFDSDDFFITEPNVSECTRFFVNPSIYYGKPFIDWWENHPKNPTPCDDHCHERIQCRHGIWRGETNKGE